jgi:hypothetical protein
VAKGCVPQIMSQGDCFGQVLIKTEGAGDCPGDLRNF